MVLVPKLGDVDFGQTDANSEFVIAKKFNVRPLFIEAYAAPPIHDFDAIVRGARFFIVGQKGTGKTSILRYVQSVKDAAGYSTDFLIFRNEILTEKDLLTFNWPILIDDNKIKSLAATHYLHCLKRILLFTIINQHTMSKALADAEATTNKEDDGWWAAAIRQLKDKPKLMVQIAFDTIQMALEAVTLDSEKLSKGFVQVDPAKILKRQNDELMDKVCRWLKDSAAHVAIFVDEIQFAYRDANTQRQDSMLVRDTILAINNINERLIHEQIDCMIYAAFRSEFLENPVIAAADVNNAISSYGEKLSWATFPADAKHPIFEIIAKRIARSTHSKFNGSDLFNSYLVNIDAQRFIEFTWSKPRDVIRFFGIAHRMFPAKVTLDINELNACFREYSAESWNEIRSAMTGFISEDDILSVEELMRKVAPLSFKTATTLTDSTFKDEIRGLRLKSGPSVEQIYQLLYMLGVFQTFSRTIDNQTIVNSYHRGNRYPAENSFVRLHRAVARAFS